MQKRNPRRQGATLIEVLVAIFIMGIGMVALLVLFPLGALRMAQAIQSERSAQAAVSASSLANVANIRRDAMVYDPANNIDAYYNPLPGAFANLEKKSYPVFIDPVGFFSAAGTGSQTSVGNPLGGFLLGRRSVSFVGAPADVYRWFTFLDELTYDKEGLAKSVQLLPLPAPPLVERDIRYSCAFLCQRPRTADVATVDCSVVIYNNRPLGLAGGFDLPENPYFLFDVPTGTPEVAFYPNENKISIYYGFPFTGPPYNKGGVRPNIRPGDWVLDVSVIPAGGGTVEPHGYFYRVAGVADLVDGLGRPYLDLETQQPLRGFPTVPAGVGITTQAGARLLFLEGVAEVFERGVGKNP